ncbi:transmembrane protein 107 isoform X2 [Oncorhynchus mykiss]|uniref:transmembrane protein 107 isoform X2 n=1 Tax=Oncorhynchus mykiss TaxID=8022 RepID=UPI001878E4FB|nr:transmembrane protein 107 isoform X2 [Oncorhynchus mykiss]
MSAVSSLVPARFLTLTAHLVIVILVTGPIRQGGHQVGGSVASHHGSVCYRAGWLLLWCVYVQLHPGPPLHHPCIHLSIHTLATAAHASASVALLFFLFEQWACEIYWWILAFCSVLPAFVEILLFIAVFGLKKKPL